MKKKKAILTVVPVLLLCATFSMTVCAQGNVAGAIEGTWKDASAQIKEVTNKVVFPCIDMILAIFKTRSFLPGLYVGLVLAFVVFVVILFFLCCCSRQKTKV